MEDEVKNRFAEVEKQILSLISRLEALEGQAAELQARVGESKLLPPEFAPEEKTAKLSDVRKLENKLNSIYSELSERIDIFEKLVEDFTKPEFKKSIEEVRRIKEDFAISKQQRQLSEEKIQKTLSLFADRQNVFVSNVQASILDFNQKLEKLEQAVDGISKNAERASDVAHNLQNKISDLEMKIADVERRFNELENFIITSKLSEPRVIE